MNNKKIKNINSQGEKQSLLFTILISIVVVLIGLFIMSKKEDMDFDEVLTFGLANNSFQLDVEDYKEYDGNDLLLQYAAVKEGEEFNVKNVFFNQKMDTHPPLYYLLVNFVSSLRKGTFSMWYGLIINLFFLIILFWEMRYLFKLVIDDNIMATVLSLLSLFAYGFVNEIVFIRMYVMLSAISMGFAILIIRRIENYGKENNKLIFPILFFILCVLGILTQYHFTILAFYFSVLLGIFLLYKKDYKSLFITIAAGLLSIAVSLMIFPQMINHLFGEESLHAFNGSQIHSLSERLYEIVLTVHRAFFGPGFIPYLIVLFIAIIFSYKKLAKEKAKFKDVIISNRIYFAILGCCIFYYFVISFTVKYTFARYLYNIYPLIIVSIIAAVYLLYKKISPNLKYLSLIILLMLVITSRLKGEPFSLNVSNKAFYEFLSNNSNTKILALYRSLSVEGRADEQHTSIWKLPRPLYSFRDMNSVSFVDLSKNETILRGDNISKENAIFLLIYTTENDEQIIGNIMENAKFTNVNKIIDTTYYHMYKLSK